MNTLFRQLSRWALLISLCPLLCGCLIKPYQFDLYQGNILSPEKIAQFEVGMSPEQVQYLLGSPVLNDVFETDRWDYVYLEKPNKCARVRRHLAVYFEHGHVIRVTHDPLSELA